MKICNFNTLITGDVAFGGSELHEGEGHYNDEWKPKGFDTKKIFISPSIKYSGCPVYAKKKRYATTNLVARARDPLWRNREALGKSPEESTEFAAFYDCRIQYARQARNC